jgi:hypothetical protein
MGGAGDHVEKARSQTHKNYEDLLRGLDALEQDIDYSDNPAEMQGNMMKRLGMHPDTKERADGSLGEKAGLFQELGATLSKEKIVDMMKDIIGKESKLKKILNPVGNSIAC